MQVNVIASNCSHIPVVITVTTQLLTPLWESGNYTCSYTGIDIYSALVRQQLVDSPHQ